MQFTGQDVIIAVALTLGLVKIFRGPLGAALAERIRGAARRRAIRPSPRRWTTCAADWPRSRNG